MTNNRTITDDKVNTPKLNVLGWITTATVFAASACLIVSWWM